MMRVARPWSERRRWPWLLLVVAAVLVVGLVGSARQGSTIAWEQRVPVASGEAHRGPWRMNRSDFRFVDDATVATDARGRLAVAWADQAKQDLFVQRYDADGEALLETPTAVSRHRRTFSWLPRVTLTPDGEGVHLLWQEIIFSGGSHGGEILFARSDDGGRTFTPPVNLSNTEAGAGKGRLSAQRWHNGSLDLARAADGTLYAAWTEYEGRLWLRRSTDGGRTFTEPVRVAGGPGAPPARGPSLAVGADGTVHLTWTVGERPAADIQYTTSTEDGRTFAPARTVGASDGHADAPKIAVDGTGVVHLAYAESPEGPRGRYHLRYARARPDGSFEPPRRVGGLQGPPVAEEHFPHLALDAQDRVVLLYEVFRAGRERPQGLALTHSADGGDSFAPPVAVPGISGPELGINGSLQGLLMRKLAAHGDGHIAVVNSTFRRGVSSHVWLLRGRIDAGEAGGGS